MNLSYPIKKLEVLKTISVGKRRTLHEILLVFQYNYYQAMSDVEINKCRTILRQNKLSLGAKNRYKTDVVKIANTKADLKQGIASRLIEADGSGKFRVTDKGWELANEYIRYTGVYYSSVNIQKLLDDCIMHEVKAVDESEIENCVL